MAAPDSNEQEYSSDEPKIYPVQLAFRKVRLCNLISEMAFKLSGPCDQIVDMYTRLAKVYWVDLTPKIETAAAYKKDIDDLKIKAHSTKASFLVMINSREQLMQSARKGLILDVFTTDGLNAVMKRIELATQFTKEAVNEINQITATMEANLRGDNEDSELAF